MILFSWYNFIYYERLGKKRIQLYLIMYNTSNFGENRVRGDKNDAREIL